MNKPFALLPDVDCETLKKWLATAKFKPDITIINKLNQLTTGAYGPDMSHRIANIQRLDDAYSSVVNMDYFPITISQLPIVNGQRLGPGQFLNYIRTNINNFTYDDMFSPYNENGIDDVALWNSTSPKGALIKIDLPNTLDDGTVITSYSSTDNWTFTTVYEPKFGEHPVSGNRNFGYTANQDGTFTFYTRGVDRLTTWESSWINWATNYPFIAADSLWENFQSKITTFVLNHSGQASVTSPEKFRPDYVDVKKVLIGKKPLSYLSKDCPD